MAFLTDLLKTSGNFTVGISDIIGVGAKGADILRAGTLNEVRLLLDAENVENTSDLGKPISTATQAALDLKAGDAVTTSALAGKASAVHTHLLDDVTDISALGADIAASTTAAAAKALLSLENADNTTDINKPISTATQAALDLKATVASVDLKADVSALSAHTGNVSNPHSVTKDQLGLGNVNDTTDLNKPVSTATQAALDNKAASAHTHTTAAVTDITAFGTGVVSATNLAALYLLLGGSSVKYIGTMPTAVVPDASNQLGITDTGKIYVSLDGVDWGQITNEAITTAAYAETAGTANIALAAGGDLLTFLTGLQVTSTKDAPGGYAGLNGLGQIARTQLPELTSADLTDATSTGRGVIAGTPASIKTLLILQNVNNTTDIDKPVSTAAQAVLNTKEADLGDPAVDGYILSSTSAGVRSWIENVSAGGLHSELEGLAIGDDHPQYLTSARGDARYALGTPAENDYVLSSMIDGTKHWVPKGDALGTPTENDYVLSSLTNGVKSWVDKSIGVVFPISGTAATFNNIRPGYTTVVGPGYGDGACSPYLPVDSPTDPRYPVGTCLTFIQNSSTRVVVQHDPELQFNRGLLGTSGEITQATWSTNGVGSTMRLLKTSAEADWCVHIAPACDPAEIGIAPDDGPIAAMRGREIEHRLEAISAYDAVCLVLLHFESTAGLGVNNSYDAMANHGSKPCMFVRVPRAGSMDARSWEVDGVGGKFGANALRVQDSAAGPLCSGLRLPLLEFLGVFRGNFTIEFWIYLPSPQTQEFSDFLGVTDAGPEVIGSGDVLGKYLGLGYEGTTQQLRLVMGTSGAVNSTHTFSLDTWHHVAVVRDTAAIKVYVDGVQEISTTPPAAFGAFNFAWHDQSYIDLGETAATSPPNIGDWYINRKIDEFRLSAIARYTADFTPPTARFPSPASKAAAAGGTLAQLSDVEDTAPADKSALVWSSGTSTWAPDAAAFAPKYLSINDQIEVTYVPTIADDQAFITCTNAAPITLTLPTNADVAFPIGATMTLYQAGAGRIEFGGDGGVIIETLGSAYATSGQYGVATLFQRATDTWVLTGDLAV